MSGDSPSRPLIRTVVAIAQTITLIGLVIGAAMAVIEYQDSQKDRAIDRALHYADKFRDPSAGLQDAAQTLEDFSLKYWEALSANDNFDHSSYVITAIDSDIELKRAVARLISHYDSIAICTMEGLCEEDTVRALIAYELKEFRNAVYPWLVADIRKYKSQRGRAMLCLERHFRTTEAADETPWWRGGPQPPCGSAEMSETMAKVLGD